MVATRPLYLWLGAATSRRYRQAVRGPFRSTQARSTQAGGGAWRPAPTRAVDACRLFAWATDSHASGRTLHSDRKRFRRRGRLRVRLGKGTRLRVRVRTADLSIRSPSSGRRERVPQEAHEAHEAALCWQPGSGTSAK